MNTINLIIRTVIYFLVLFGLLFLIYWKNILGLGKDIESRDQAVSYALTISFLAAVIYFLLNYFQVFS